MTDRRAGRRLVRERARQRVEVGLRPQETAADVELDVERSFALVDRLIEGGTNSWQSRYRWLGPLKFMAYKEVGPPPWRWPRIGVQPSLRGKPFVRFIVGWRSTAYAVCVMWAGPHGHSESVVSDEPTNASDATIGPNPGGGQ